ncbi:prolyl oligopeptidase [Pelomyxa schiedti]|nr:prolyl oligopeptidase [Pelomyxa schiedti]
MLRSLSLFYSIVIVMSHAAVDGVAVPGPTSGDGHTEIATTTSTSASGVGRRWKYPVTRVSEEFVAENDRFRWLEGSADDSEIAKWVEEQNLVTASLYEEERVRECRSELKESLAAAYNYPKFTCTRKAGRRYMHSANTGLQNQHVMFLQNDGPDATCEARVLLDPNTMSKDGTVAISLSTFSESGEYLAYGLSASGSDWVTIHVMHVEDRAELPDDVLKWVKFSSIAWLHDDTGFFYARYPEPSVSDASTAADSTAPKAGMELETALHHTVYFHKLGTPQSKDVIVVDDPENPERLFGVELTDDGLWLIATVWEGCKPANKLWITNARLASLGRVEGRPVPFLLLVDQLDWEYSYLTNEEGMFFFKTNEKAPKNKVVRVDLSAVLQSGTGGNEGVSTLVWSDVIPESADVLTFVSCIRKDILAVCYMHDVHDVLTLRNLFTGDLLSEVPLPDIGSVSEFSGKKRDREFFFSFTSFLFPTVVLRGEVSPVGEKWALDIRILRTTVVPGIDSNQFETKQVFYNSADGTRIPMFILQKKGTELNGNNPTVLYGYGGFNIAMTPTFNPLRLVFMKKYGLCWAIANLRGGSEYGEEWHQAALFEKKQNVFDDFVAAAKYLFTSQYTNPQKLAILGGSNGGLLVGATVNQHPELFGCAVSQVGVLDMLRYHKFTIGHAWTTEYGNADIPEQREYIIKYSPLHTVRDDVPYPAVLLTTADHDDRVVPLHSFKFIAELQSKLGNKPFQTKPLLIRIDVKSGHGAGKPTMKAIEEVADIYTFMAHSLGLLG